MQNAEVAEARSRGRAAAIAIGAARCRALLLRRAVRRAAACRRRRPFSQPERLRQAPVSSYQQAAWRLREAAGTRGRGLFRRAQIAAASQRPVAQPRRGKSGRKRTPGVPVLGGDGGAHSNAQRLNSNSERLARSCPRRKVAAARPRGPLLSPPGPSSPLPAAALHQLAPWLQLAAEQRYWLPSGGRRRCNKLAHGNPAPKITSISYTCSCAAASEAR